MSYNVEVFAEVKDGDIWVLVDRVHDNFKWLIEKEYVDGLPYIELDKLSAGMWHYSPKVEPRYGYGAYIEGTRPKVVSHKDLEDYAERLCEKSTTIKKMLFSALGMPDYVDDEDIEVEDDKYTSDGNIDPAWNPLTHPVDKRMFKQMQEADFGFMKGNRIRGMLDTVAQ